MNQQHELPIHIIEINLTLAVRDWVRANVQDIVYRRSKIEKMMYCSFHMRNGFEFIGRASLMPDGNVDVATNSARRDGLKQVIRVAQYLFMDKLAQ
jgi:hypothetical protein